MREYNTPELKVLNVELTDIICTSSVDGGLNNAGQGNMTGAGSGAIG